MSLFSFANTQLTTAYGESGANILLFTYGMKHPEFKWNYPDEAVKRLEEVHAYSSLSFLTSRRKNLFFKWFSIRTRVSVDCSVCFVFNLSRHAYWCDEPSLTRASTQTHEELNGARINHTKIRWLHRKKFKETSYVKKPSSSIDVSVHPSYLILFLFKRKTVKSNGFGFRFYWSTKKGRNWISNRTPSHAFIHE